MKKKRVRRTKLQIQEQRNEELRLLTESQQLIQKQDAINARIKNPVKVDGDTIHYWAKFNPTQPVFTNVSSYISKLEKSNKRFNILWLYTLDFEVICDGSVRTFYYSSDNQEQ